MKKVPVQTQENAQSFGAFKSRMNAKSRKELEFLLYESTKAIAFLDDQNRALSYSHSKCNFVAKLFSWFWKKVWWSNYKKELSKIEQN